MSNFLSEFLRAARQAPRLYFAPLIGAINGASKALQDALNDAHPQKMDRSNRAPTSTNEER